MLATLIATFCISTFAYSFEFDNKIDGKKDVIYLGDFQEELNLPVTADTKKFVSIPKLENYLRVNSTSKLKFIEFQIVWFDENNNYTIEKSDLVVERRNDVVFITTFNCGLRVHYEQPSELRFAITSNITNKYTYTNYDSQKGKVGQYALLAVMYYEPYNPYISDDQVITNENIYAENEALKSENAGLTEQNNNLLSEKQNLINQNNVLSSEKQNLIDQNNALNNNYSALQSELNTVTQQRDDAREGLRNNSAVLNFFQGVYEAVNGVLQTFFNLDVFGMSLGSVIAILLIAIVVIFVLKIFI